MPCDPAKTSLLVDLATTPRPARDLAWSQRYVDAASDACLTAGDPFAGPDGFTYLALTTTPSPSPVSLRELAPRAMSEGIGAAINPRPNGVDYVFTCGELAELALSGRMTINAPFPRTEVLAQQEQVLVGAPSRSLLPDELRRHLHRFLTSAGVASPGVFLMSRASSTPSQNLVFNLHPRQFSSQADFDKVMNRITWFVPRTVGVIALPNPERFSRFYPLLEGAAQPKRWFELWK